MDRAENIRRIKELGRLPKQPKPRKPIAKVSEKKKNQLKEEKAIRVGGGNELDRWFQARRKEMTGFCSNCGKPSCKNNNDYYKFSIAHLLPKAYVKSVATNENNWIELCFWGENSCHTQMDNGLLDLTEMNCWNEIVVKFQKLYPYISDKEKRRIPDVLLQYLKTDI